MQRHLVTRIGLLAAAAAIIGACAGGTSAPGTSSGPSASSSEAPAPVPAYRLRATMIQATPPLTRFGWLPVVAITGDLQVVVPGPMIEIYPGPLLPNLQAQPISAAGYAKIVEYARTLGLLSGSGDFTPQEVMPGASLGRVEIIVDGVLHDLTGDPSRIVRCGDPRCVPVPGTPEAFGGFWQALTDMGWLRADLGPEKPYVAESYAILAGVEPVEQPALPPRVVTWPLDTPLAAFGKPVGNAPAPRCGTVRGAEAATLRPALVSANQLTRWVDKDAAPAVGTVIQVRPMIPGEDICRELFGLVD